MSFGDNLRFIRKQKNITQEQLAEMLDVSRQAISKWESNNGYPETEKLIVLSQKLDVSLDYLLNDKSNGVDQPKSAVYAPGGKIAITTYDGLDIVNCQAVKSSRILGNGKGPAYILNGIDGVSFWGEHTTLLGWYRDAESIQKEIGEINLAIQRGEPSCALKYFVPVEFRGIFGQPYMIDQEG